MDLALADSPGTSHHDLMILRGLGIWTGVGIGHLAVLGALWSGSGEPPVAAAPLALDLRFVSPSAEPPSAPPLLPPVAIGVDLPAAPPSPREPRPAPLLAAASLAAPASQPLAPAGEAAARPTPGFEAAPPPVRPALALPPRFLERVDPSYPVRARRAGIEGAVTLALRLSEQGELIEARILRGSGSELLDEAALAAARASRFAPASLDGRSIPSETEATYRFVLR